MAGSAEPAPERRVSVHGLVHFKKTAGSWAVNVKLGCGVLLALDIMFLYQLKCCVLNLLAGQLTLETVSKLLVVGVLLYLYGRVHRDKAA